MTIHLIKLAVGIENVSDLKARQAQRLKNKIRERQKPELIHITRNMPRRADELLDGGSIYWVIKGRICARQKLLELREVQQDGLPFCGIVFDKKVIPVRPRPHRPFQGWRYLEAKSVPPDIIKGKEAPDLSLQIQQELIELGLL